MQSLRDRIFWSGTIAATGLLLIASTAHGRDSQVLIPAGEFRMGTEAGTDAERPVHTVWIDSFHIDHTEVSNREFSMFQKNHQSGSQSACDECPVTRVTWREADAYCKSKGQRLPTEAEWEKAARGPQGLDYSFGSLANRGKAHFGKPLKTGAVPVDAMDPNGYGLHHMSGNVWEWTSDWFDPAYYKSSPPKNPQGPDDGFRKVVRGGNWYSQPYYVHTGMRFALEPGVRLASMGFRCARDP